MATFQIKASDEVAAKASELIGSYADRTGSTRGEALEALIPALERATAGKVDPEVAAQVAEAERLTTALIAQVNSLASRVGTARSEERAAVTEELAEARKLADERAIEIQAAEEEIKALKAEIGELGERLTRSQMEAAELKAQLNAALGLAEKIELAG